MKTRIIALMAFALAGCLQNPQDGPETTASSPALTALAVFPGTLSPVFDSATLNYSVTVGGDVQSFTVVPTASAKSDPSVFVNGEAVLSGNLSQAIALSEGENTVSIVVTATGGKKTTYKLTVTRGHPSADVGLARLSLKAKNVDYFASGLAHPEFNPSDTVYNLDVEDLQPFADTLMIAAAANDSLAATVTLDGSTLPRGGSRSVTLKPGLNTFKIAVANGGTKRTYTLLVTRQTDTFAFPVMVYLGAQGSVTASAYDLDDRKEMLSAEAKANQEKIDLVFLYYDGGLHLDDPISAKTAGIAYGINLTSGYDDNRIKQTEIVKVTTAPKDMASARAAFDAGTLSYSQVITGGETLLAKTEEGNLAVITAIQVSGSGATAGLAFKLSIGRY